MPPANDSPAITQNSHSTLTRAIKLLFVHKTLPTLMDCKYQCLCQPMHALWVRTTYIYSRKKLLDNCKLQPHTTTTHHRIDIVRLPHAQTIPLPLQLQSQSHLAHTSHQRNSVTTRSLILSWISCSVTVSLFNAGVRGILSPLYPFTRRPNTHPRELQTRSQAYYPVCILMRNACILVPLRPGFQRKVPRYI